ncbi:hypothetical protein [Rhodoblastus sp.]
MSAPVVAVLASGRDFDGRRVEAAVMHVAVDRRGGPLAWRRG